MDPEVVPDCVVELVDGYVDGVVVLPELVAPEVPEPLEVPEVPVAVEDVVESLVVPLCELDVPEVGEVDDVSDELLLGGVDFGWVWLEEELDCACSASAANSATVLEVTTLRRFFIA